MWSQHKKGVFLSQYLWHSLDVQSLAQKELEGISFTPQTTTIFWMTISPIELKQKYCKSEETQVNVLILFSVIEFCGHNGIIIFFLLFSQKLLLQLKWLSMEQFVGDLVAWKLTEPKVCVFPKSHYTYHIISTIFYICIICLCKQEIVARKVI